MKATNNTNEDLKAEIEKLMDKNSRLQMLVDDQEIIVENNKKAI